MPEYEVTGLNEFYVDELNVGTLLSRLNSKIEILVDRDHQIGHSYFIKLKKKKEQDHKQALYDVWYCEVIPLLQEYFYNDYEKLAHLLGKYHRGEAGESGFIDKKPDGEIKNLISSYDGGFSDLYIGAIHKYETPDELIKVLMYYVQ